MCVYIYVYIYIYIYIHIYIYVCVCVCVHMYMKTHTSTHTHIVTLIGRGALPKKGESANAPGQQKRAGASRVPRGASRVRVSPSSLVWQFLCMCVDKHMFMYIYRYQQRVHGEADMEEG